jgi:hypothetical protein
MKRTDGWKYKHYLPIARSFTHVVQGSAEMNEAQAIEQRHMKERVGSLSGYEAISQETPLTGCVCGS